MTTSKVAFDKIPWKFRGRATPFAKLAQSIVPVGNRDPSTISDDPNAFVGSDSSEFEAVLMDIVGTAFQVGEGKLLTCWHVAQGLQISSGAASFLASSTMTGIPAKRYYGMSAAINFIDPRSDKNNPAVDAAMLLSPAVNTVEAPYLVPKVEWGDSTKLGVGDRVMIAGFPLGRSMFTTTETNRGLVQPTFYDGIVSAIMPALAPGETRMLQISTVALGGVSGGVVCDARTAKVLGMVTSGLTDSNGSALPITYAIPSEVLRPWSDSISFTGPDGRRWR